MDEKSYLILVYNKNEDSWKDSTAKICKYLEGEDKTEIKFNGNDTTYTYGNDKIKAFTRPNPLDLDKFIVKKKDDGSTQWESAVIFEQYICLFTPRIKKLLKLKDVVITENIANDHSTRKLIDYYGALVSILKGSSFHLGLYFERNLKVIQRDSFLNHFINGIKPSKRSNNSMTPIFPFGINLSQRQAVINALFNQASVIQGPPGTGKTQTILNVIANIIMREESVAVVAGNNSAVSNVFEKLEGLNIEFIAALLGSGSNQQEFFSERKSIPPLKNWVLEKKLLTYLRVRLYDLNKEITELLEAQNQLALITEKLNRLRVEKKYYLRNFNVQPINLNGCSIFNKWSSPNLLDFLSDFYYYSKSNKVPIITKFRWLFKFGIYKYSDLERSKIEAIKRIVMEFYDKKEAELQESKEKLSLLLKEKAFDELLEEIRECSLKIFKDYLGRYYEKKQGDEFDEKNYKRKFEEFIKRYPVVLSTTDSIINNKSDTELFDYLIVDEASQVDLITGFLSMACAKNIVVVGDLKQLTHIADKKIVKENKSIDSDFDIQPGYSYIHESLLSSVLTIFADRLPKVLLKEHYRCHPRIIDFCNQKYYGGELVVMTEGVNDAFKIYKTVKGNHARRPSSGDGYINERELDVTENEILPIELELYEREEIGTISPYRKQADRAQSRFESSGIDADTIYKFQGREKDLIILLTTLNRITRFNDNPNLINVAVSRAKKQFIVVSSQEIFKTHGTNIGDLIRHVEYQSLDNAIFESKTVSIFDCLYESYSESLEPFRKKVKRKSKYLSEDLMATLLDEFLTMSEYDFLSYERDYMLSILLKDNVSLTQREIQFASHHKSHIDFLLFNKFDRLPVLAIEVDGYKYHE
ncbi:MAG: AAA domain-containing protein, partial [Kangiellaceae bacterium]|nr:AAA domain-containing protein [Kangiellaceae bacterium]